MELKITSTTQHNREHNRAPCPTAPSAHASYKGYGCNNAKPPRPPHRNTMIDVEVLGCGPIWTDEGAMAPFIGVHILGEIWPVGGGLIPWPKCDGRTKLDRLSRSKKSTIPQSTIGGLFMFSESAVGRNGGPVCGDGNLGECSTLKGGGRHGQLVTGWSISRHGQLVTGWSISMGPPALTQLKHHNQPQFGSVGAGSPRERLRFVAYIFSELRPAGGLKASLNCDWADEFDRSTRLLASKT
jgi:hypothetical protein